MGLDRDAMLLKAVPLFAAFELDQLRLIAFSAEIITLPPKTILFREGASADCGYLLTSGSILLQSNETGKEQVVDDVGTLIGELALLTAVTRPATAASITETRLMVLSQRLLRRVLEEYPAMAEILHMTLSERLVELTQDLRRVQPAFDQD